MKKPNPTVGLRHIALLVKNLEACVTFYTDCLGMKIEWQPDPDNVYLSSGTDNLALHRAPAHFVAAKEQSLDHLGFFLAERQDVDEWFNFLQSKQVEIKFLPKDHRDGTRSFYCSDPEGNVIQLIYYPMIKKS